VTALAEPNLAVRPPEPRRSRDFVGPIVGFGILLGFAGLAGPAGPIWGAVIGALVFGLFWWIQLTRSVADAVILVVGGAVGYSLFNLALAARDTGVTIGVGAQAALGVGVFGLAAGLVMYRNSPGLTPVPILLSGAAYGGGAYVVLLTAVALGLLDKIRDGEQELTIALFVAVSIASGVIGATANISFWSKLPSSFAVGFSFIISVLAWNEIGFSIAEVFTQMTRITELLADFWPPDFVWSKSPGQPQTFNMGKALLETFQIAIMGATVGCAVAAPLAFYASRPTSPNSTVYWLSKSFLNVIRTIPDLFWAVLFATAVGFGKPFAGALAMVMFSIAIMGKLLSETVDAIDLGPLEASKAAGATNNQTIMKAAFPQIAPNFVAYALYVFELNIRASVVLGFVGAGGIGRLLDERRQFFQWDQVMAIVIVIFVSVIVIEVISILIRRKIV
jgi:phosphonate transport system permease protein